MADENVKNVKAFHLTSEFWLTMIGNVAALLTTISGVLDARYAIIIATVANGMYAISRGLAKQK